MKLKKLGKNTSKVEIHTSPFGMWLLVHDLEYFLSYKDFPWFTDAKLSDIYSVELLNEHHLRWEALDVDLELDSISNLEKYPLIYKNNH